MAELKRLGVEVHARSVFLQGLLLMDAGALPARLQAAASPLSAVHARIAAAGRSPLQAAISFVLDRPEIDVALVGVTSRSELAQIIAAAAAPSPDLDWNACALHDPFILTPSLWPQPSMGDRS